MKIGIFGGSFNPIHKGHIGVAKEAMEELGLDKLIFVPAYKSPFKSKIKYEDAEHRVQMIELVKPENSEVSKFEINRKGTSYTIDTVRYMKQQYPNDELFLLIGTDNLYKLHKWRNIDEISELVKIAVFRREGSWSKENIKRFECKLLNNKIYDFSSTGLRNGHFENVSKEVAEYIGKHRLYVSDIMLGMLEPVRHKHSKTAGDYAAKYAKVLGYDANKAWFAGSVHDITKSMPKEWHREFLERKGHFDVPDHLLHSMSGYYWLRDVYNIKDEEILNSIWKHTTLAMELDDLDKIVYAADKLCEGRRFEGIQSLRKLILEDFDEGFKQIVSITHQHLKEKRDLSPEQEEIYMKWGK